MNDIVITSDCNINILDGKKINLNGYSLTIKNQFDGAMYINGDSSSIYTTNTSEGTTNQIIVDCPYSAVIFEDGIIAEGITKNVIDENQQEIINSAYKYIFANIQNVGINDFYNLSVEEINISNHECDFETHSNDTYGCIYTHTDLEFIYNYLSYDLDISYESLNPNILSNNGNLLNTDQTSVVRLGISINEETRYIDVHVLNTEDYDKAALNVMLEYLDRYYGEELNEDGTVVEGSYLHTFDGPLMLPRFDTYFNQEYYYTLSDGKTIDTSEIYHSTRDEILSGDYFELINADGTDSVEKDYYVLLIDSKIKYLHLATSGGAYITLSIKQLAADTLEDNSSYAEGFLRDLYGNQIDIYEEEDKPSGYTETYLLETPNADIYSYGKISSVSYELLGNIDNTYEIVNGKTTNGAVWKMLRYNTASTVKPNVTQTIFLQATFDFYEGDDPVIQTSIVFNLDHDDESFGFDDFIQYYTFFDREFTISCNNYTYHNFDIPFTFGNKLPAFNFKVYEKVYYEELDEYVYSEVNKNLFTFYLVDGETNINIDELIYKNPNAGDVINAAVSSGLARLRVDINPYYVNTNTTEYKFIYVPIYTSGSDAYYIWNDGSGSKQYKTLYEDTSLEEANRQWVHINPTTTVTLADNTTFTYVLNIDMERYEYISELTVPGLLRYQCSNSVITEEFYDYNLYMLVYEKMYGDTYVEGETFIETDLTYLVTEISLATKTYETLRGINHLKNVKILNLNGFALLAGDGKFYTQNIDGAYYLTHEINNMNEITYLSQMTGLEQLYLQNSGIQDYAMANTSLPNGNSNEFLSILANLSNLRILDISNAEGSTTMLNRIYEFTALEEFASLQTVYVGNITFESDFEILGIDIGAAFEPMSNSLYGSGGAVNIGVVTTLEARGCTVVGYKANSADFSSAIFAIANLQYQNQVPKNVALATVLSQYSQGNSAAIANQYGIVTFTDLSHLMDAGSLQLTFSSIEFIVDTSVPEEQRTTFTVRVTYTYNATTTNFWGQQENETGSIPFDSTYKVERY
jgi:hypothetical protein